MATKSNESESYNNSIDYYKCLITVIDTTFSMMIVAPITIFYWRSTWDLSIFLLSETKWSPFISLFAGIVVMYMLYLSQNQLNYHLDPGRRQFSFLVFSRIYSKVFAVFCINMWRGVWAICDYVNGTYTLEFTIAYTLMAFSFLIYSRGIRNLLASPFLLFPDCYRVYFYVDTYFKCQVSIILFMSIVILCFLKSKLFKN